jgi:hypothetical protein
METYDSHPAIRDACARSIRGHAEKIDMNNLALETRRTQRIADEIAPEPTSLLSEYRFGPRGAKERASPTRGFWQGPL